MPASSLLETGSGSSPQSSAALGSRFAGVPQDPFCCTHLRMLSRCARGSPNRSLIVPPVLLRTGRQLSHRSRLSQLTPARRELLANERRPGTLKEIAEDRSCCSGWWCSIPAVQAAFELP